MLISTNRGFCINYIVFFIMYIYTKVISACFSGGFGSVYKGSLADGTLVAVKKLDRVLPHGEKEFITEVNTIGSMHHMNLVRLCGYCSEGSQR
jgi:serine/threonine protein kinase